MMQLVVMAAVLAVAGAERNCSNCRLTNFSFSVEGCGITENVHTTICTGQCYHKDPVYGDYSEPEVCSGDWSYEVKHIDGCPVGITYPVARNCKCASCTSGDMYCGRFPGVMPSCSSF